MARPLRIRSLWPREHGAYVQLLVPLATALIAVPPTFSGAAIALGALLSFLACEPLRVALGDRGPRVRETDGPRARRRAAALLLGALVAGAAGLALASPETWQIAVAVAAVAAVVVLFAQRGAVHTALGEVVAACALAGAGAPVAVAGGLAVGDAVVIWAVWTLGNAATVVAVHRVLDRHRDGAARPPLARGAALAGVVVALAALGARVAAAWFAVPLVALASALVLWPPRATRLRAIGVGFLLCSLVAAGCAVAAVRNGDAAWYEGAR